MDFELLVTLTKELNTTLIVVTPLRCFIDNYTDYRNTFDKLTLLNSIINNIKGQIELLYPQHNTLIILCDKILFSQIQDSMSLAIILSMHGHKRDITLEYITPLSPDIDSFFNENNYADNNILDRRTGIDRFFNEDGYISPIENDDYDESYDCDNSNIIYSHKKREAYNISDMIIEDHNDIMFKQSLCSDDEGSFHSYVSNYDEL